MICNYILPTHNILLTPDKQIHECLLSQGHEGDHLVQISTGEYILWQIDNSCDCPDFCECFIYHYANPATVARLIQ